MAGVVDHNLQQKFEEHNQEFEVTNPYIEYVQEYFVPAHPKSPNVEMISTTKMIESINDMKRSEVIPPNAASTIGKILRKIGFAEPEKRRINKINGRWYPIFTRTFFNDNKDKMEIVDGKYYYSDKGDSTTANIVDSKPDKPNDPTLGEILDMI